LWIVWKHISVTLGGGWTWRWRRGDPVGEDYCFFISADLRSNIVAVEGKTIVILIAVTTQDSTFL
jgi:hypothetical protein